MSERMKQPYIGVSGVINPEVQRMVEAMAVENGLPERNRAVALGVKAVHKTQYLDIENKYGPEWYPIGERAFSEALRRDVANKNSIGVAQAYFDIHHVADSEYRQAFLQRILQRGQPWLDAIQFDMLPWHDNPDMWAFLESVKKEGLQVFLQAHGMSMSTLGPEKSVRTLQQHAELIDYVLFDASHGTGTRLDVAALRPFIAEAYEQFDSSQTGVAVAGGLNSQRVREDLAQLVQEFPHLSWDAEGQLHPENAAGKRPLDMDTTRDYLAASSSIISS